MDQVENRVRWDSEAAKWRKAHPALNLTLIWIPVLLSVAGIAACLTGIPQLAWPPFARVFLFSIAHGWLTYSLAVYSLHEGAAHSRNFGIGIVCRFLGADPEYYRANHIEHHRHLGTDRDRTYTHWVDRRRFFLSLLPGALLFSDFGVNIGKSWTSSKILTVLATSAFLAFQISFTLEAWGLVPSLAAILVFSPWVGQILDRLRDSTEHVLRPADRDLGGRDFGLGWYGWIVCGGPWGQPYHLTHHLWPSLPWYQQIQFGRRLDAILDREQIEFQAARSSSGFSLLKKCWRNT